MSVVTVQALQPFTHEGLRVSRGDAVQLPAGVAAGYARKGYVSLTVGARIDRVDPVAVRQVSRRGRRSTDGTPKRAYRRRDMVAESAE